MARPASTGQAARVWRAPKPRAAPAAEKVLTPLAGSCIDLTDHLLHRRVFNRHVLDPALGQRKLDHPVDPGDARVDLEYRDVRLARSFQHAWKIESDRRREGLKGHDFTCQELPAQLVGWLVDDNSAFVDDDDAIA